MELNVLQTAQLQLGHAKAQQAAQKTLTAEDARKAAEEFEALFLAQMLAPMFNTISTDGPFGGGHSETIYRSMMVDELGKATMQNGGIGIADNVMREILRAQELAQ